MHQPDATPDYRKGLSTTLAIAALTGATVVALTLPVANADPTTPPADPNAPAPAPPPPPEPGRVDNAAGGFSYVVPAGWKVADATQLSYGQALLNKIPAEAVQPNGQPAQPPSDTSVLLGRL